MFGHRQSQTPTHRRWSAHPKALLLTSMLVGATALAAVFAGAGSVLPIGHETVQENGVAQSYLVINPAQGAQAPDCPDGTLRVTIPTFALVRSQPALYGIPAGTTEQGQIMCVLSVNSDGWAQVRWSSGQSAWVEPGTFRMVRLQIAEVSETSQDTSQPQPPITSSAPPKPTPIPPTPTPVPPTPTPVPSSGITGGGGIVVSQSLTARAGQVIGANGLVTVNDEGSAFTVAVETTVGSTFQVRLMLRNASSSVLNGNIQLQLPAGFQVGATKNDGVTQIGQIAADTWLFTMAGSHNNLVWDVGFTIKAPAEVSPGFTGFKGLIKQVAS